MVTFKEDRIARGWKKGFPKRKKEQMTKKEEHEFFGHKFERKEHEFFGHKFGCKEQKLVRFNQIISFKSEELYDIYCDKNGQICEVTPVDEISKSFLNFHRGVPLKLLFNE